MPITCADQEQGNPQVTALTMLRRDGDPRATAAGPPPPDPDAVEAHDDDLARAARARLPVQTAGVGWLGPLAGHRPGVPPADLAHLARRGCSPFDETYYAKDAWSLLHFGYERQPIAQRRPALLIGNGHIYSTDAEWATHPPLGKWVIAIGEQIFGITPFGAASWPSLFGTLSVLVLAGRSAGCSAPTCSAASPGLLLAIDGLAIVMSRTSLLDIFLMAFVLFAFACLVIDRDKVRGRLLDWSVIPGPRTARCGAESARPGPWLGARPVADSQRRAAWAGLRHQVERGLLPGRLRPHVLAVGPVARRVAGIRRTDPGSFVGTPG